MTTRTPIRLPHSVDDGVGARARIGLIVLSSDLTLEAEINSLPIDGLAIHHARIENDPIVTAETLTAMHARIPATARLLPAGFGFEAIGYGCTSASTLIGDDAVERAVHEAHPGVPVTNPVKAAVAAFSALGVERVGIVTPYSEAVTLPVIERFERDGFVVSAFGSFLVEDDLIVGRTTSTAVAEGVRLVGEEADCDAFFVSCTSVPLFSSVQQLEDQVGKPIVSSNLALSWHLLRLAGIDDQLPGLGALFRSTI